MLLELKNIISQVARKMDCELIEFNAEEDHIHILWDFHPKQAISAVAGCLKSASARMLKKKFPEEIKKQYWGDVSLWSGSYYVASTGGAPIEKLKEYIKNHKEPEK